jgi:hypothetical protein
MGRALSTSRSGVVQAVSGVLSRQKVVLEAIDPKKYRCAHTVHIADLLARHILQLKHPQPSAPKVLWLGLRSVVTCGTPWTTYRPCWRVFQPTRLCATTSVCEPHPSKLARELQPARWTTSRHSSKRCRKRPCKTPFDASKRDIAVL